jgi:uncharacterized RDD family membrane protein YckC
MEERTGHENVLGPRVLAALIDMVLLGAAGLALGLLTGGGARTESANGANNYTVSLEGWWFFAWMTMAEAYFIAAEGLTGQTVGKRVLGLRVACEDGSRASWREVVGRNLLRIVDALPAFYLVGFIVAAVDHRARRIGDQAAGTCVIRVRAPADDARTPGEVARSPRSPGW